MKSIYRNIVLSCSLLFAATGALFAQSSGAAISRGTLTLFSVNGFYDSLGRQGIITSFQNGQTLAVGQVSFPIDGGFLDRNTAAGEVDSRGGITFTSGSTIVALQRLSLENTANGAIISAGVLVNGVYFGRQPVFSVTTASVAVPLPLGEATVGNIFFEVNPVFLSEVQDYFQSAPFTAGQVIGSATVDVTLVSLPQ